MNLAFLFARRYFHSGKVRNVINWISRISQLGITVGTAALIVVLSVFNGFEGVILSLYDSFDPDFKIIAVEGKYFNHDSLKIANISNIPNLKAFCEVSEENAVVKHGESQTIVTLKGMTNNYLNATGIDSMLLAGEAILNSNEADYALIGSGIAGKLEMNLFDFSQPLEIFFPNKIKPSAFSLNPSKLLNSGYLMPGGIFQIQQDFDEKYIIVPSSFIQKLTNNVGKCTAIELIFNEGTNLDKAKTDLQTIMGSGFLVKDRFEQHEFLYKIMRSEKFMVYLILSFILLIAAFNLIGSLLMLTHEKKRDMMVLNCLGAEKNLIRKIFFYEGLLLTASSAVIGIILGAGVCLIQMKFGLIKIGQGTTFIIDTYPVVFKLMDFVWVFIIVILIGLLSAWFPSRIAFKSLSLSDIQAK